MKARIYLKGQHAKHCSGCGKVIRHWNQSGYCLNCRKILYSMGKKEDEANNQNNKKPKKLVKVSNSKNSRHARKSISKAKRTSRR